MNMATSQYYRNYWTFKSKEEVVFPFEYARTLSNGIVIGKCVDDVDYGWTNEEVLEYIRENHVDELIDFVPTK